ncbi:MULTISPECIES: GNAT family N-acetyltransferase [unclassified Lacinutrix]
MRKATYVDKKIVSEILVSAFSPLQENNSINLVVKQDEKRIERMHILMEYLFERAILFGEVYISNNNKACLLLKFPHKEKVTYKTIALDIKLAFKCIGIAHVYGVLKRQIIANKNYPKENHIRPMIMGVRDEYKENGTAARLMIEVKNKYINTELPVIIDAASLKNVKMYQKFGFKVIKKEESLGFSMYFLRLN